MTIATEKDTTTRDRLIEAATRIFAEKGYDDATLREICAAAGANNAAINYHFSDKRGLYIETIKQACCGQSLCNELDAYADAPAKERLYAFIHGFLERVFDKTKTSIHTHLVMREMAHPSDATEELVRSMIRPDFEYLMQVLDELVPEGMSERQKHLTIFSIIGQCVHYRIAMPVVSILVPKKELKTYDPDLLANHICKFTLTALGIETA